MKGICRPYFQNITGYVYFIQMERIGPIKIGFTKYLEQRFNSLRTGSPYPLNVLCLFPGNEEIERDIHKGFNEMKMEGEWFLPHPFILKEIDEQNRINKINGFTNPDTDKDLGDKTLKDEVQE